jgi:hypothetical protein
MYSARPVVPLVVAKKSGRSAVSTPGSPLIMRSTYGLSVSYDEGGHAGLEVGDRADAVEAVLTSVDGVGVATDDLQQLLLLRRLRPPGGRAAGRR